MVQGIWQLWWVNVSRAETRCKGSRTDWDIIPNGGRHGVGVGGGAEAVWTDSHWSRGRIQKVKLEPIIGEQSNLVTLVVDSRLHRCYKAFQDHGGNTAVYNIGAGTASKSSHWCEEYNDNCWTSSAPLQPQRKHQSCRWGTPHPSLGFVHHP